MTFSSVKVVRLILYSFCFYIACKTAKKKRIIKFVWSELTIIRYRTIYMYAADCPLLYWVSSPKIFNLKNHEQCFSIFIFVKSKKMNYLYTSWMSDWSKINIVYRKIYLHFPCVHAKVYGILAEMNRCQIETID